MPDADAGSRLQAALFASAAEQLAGDSGADSAAQDLLRWLDYFDGSVADLPHRAALLRAAARCRRFFSLRAVHAPGLVALGAEVNPDVLGIMGEATAGVSGTGLTWREAFESCVGEAAEYLSSFAHSDDPIEILSDETALAEAPPAMGDLFQRLAPYRRDSGSTHAAWARAAALRDGRPVLLLADLCYRRDARQRDFDIPWPLSTGCGAGQDLPSAALHGLLELIERDATVLWWRGGTRARIMPPGIEGALLERLRQDVTSRKTWLLDITSDVGVPVVAALSCNDDGFGLCAGFACRPTRALAAAAALREMTQMELALQLSQAKRAVRGEAALNDIDRRHLDRYTNVNADAVTVLHPLAPPAKTCDLLGKGTLNLLAAVRMQLESLGHEAYVLNLSRSALGIPVTRVVCPGLELGLSAPAGPRLMQASLRSGGDPAAGPAL